MPATSSTQPNKVGCSKYVILQDQVEKLMCLKTEGCGLSTLFFKLYTVLDGNLMRRRKVKKKL